MSTETYCVIDTDTNKAVRWHSQWRQLRMWSACMNRCEARDRYTVRSPAHERAEKTEGEK